MTVPETEAGFRTPVWGGVLIGGKSSRMGRSKHLIEYQGVTWLELTVGKLRKKVDHVVISGGGEIPGSLTGIPVVPDVHGLKGPLAGVLALLRWKPDVSWLVTACDLPDLEAEALDWLLAMRQPETRAILPDLQANGQLEPLLAYYDTRCRGYLEEIAASGGMRLSTLAGKPGVITPQPPIHLHCSWRNVNDPDEMGRAFVIGVARVGRNE